MTSERVRKCVRCKRVMPSSYFSRPRARICDECMCNTPITVADAYGGPTEAACGECSGCLAVAGRSPGEPT